MLLSAVIVAGAILVLALAVRGKLRDLGRDVEVAQANVSSDVESAEDGIVAMLEEIRDALKDARLDELVEALAGLSPEESDRLRVLRDGSVV
jgi:uncharacterized protein YoxC